MVTLYRERRDTTQERLDATQETGDTTQKTADSPQIPKKKVEALHWILGPRVAELPEPLPARFHALTWNYSGPRPA